MTSKVTNFSTVKLTRSGYIADGILIPQDESNRHYVQLKQWIDEGGNVEPEFSLDELKNKKIAEIKSIRDQKNTEPITDHKAFILDDKGNKTSEKSFFLFYVSRHQTNPASDPNSIIARSLSLGAMPYFTKNLSGERITVELTADLAQSLHQRIAARNDQNYKAYYAIEAAIKDATTTEEVEAISEEIPN